MTEQEQQDLKTMKAAVTECKLKAFEYAEFCLRMSGNDLKNSGYKSVEHAVFTAIRDGARDAMKLTKEYVKKYPD